MEALFSTEGLIGLLTLTLLEIVLGVDNIIFISIFTGKLPQEQQSKARIIGLSLALVMRIVLLLCITWIITLQEPLFTILDYSMSIRDLILFIGGLFLMAKTTTEIHQKLEGEPEHLPQGKQIIFSYIIIQIVLIDMVFSIDSILTAIGLAREVIIMILAVIISMLVMLFFAKTISDFVHKHPTIKMLALVFLMMIGMLLMAEALHFHVPKGYVYFAMAFSLLVEMLNLRMRKKAKPVELKENFSEENN